MAGTKLGGKHAAETNKAKYGQDFYKQIGSVGGKRGTGHAFGHGKVDPRVIGAIGGRKSRRGGAKSAPIRISYIDRLGRLFK